MNNSMRLNAVLKLVVLSNYNIEWKINNNKIEADPITPDIFEIYAYPRLIDTIIEEEYYDEDQDQDLIQEYNNIPIESSKTKDEIIFQSEMDDEDENIINDEQFIKDLQADIEKKAKKEFNEFQKNDPEAQLHNERLTIKEKISDIDFSANKINEVQNKEIKQQDNVNLKNDTSEIKPKFVIKLDEDEKGKYYTNVLDTVDKIMAEHDDENKTSKTISEIVDEILDEEQKASNHNTNKKN